MPQHQQQCLPVGKSKVLIVGLAFASASTSTASIVSGQDSLQFHAHHLSSHLESSWHAKPTIPTLNTVAGTPARTPTLPLGATPAVVIVAPATPSAVENYSIAELQAYATPLQTNLTEIPVCTIPCSTIPPSAATTVLAVGPDAAKAYGYSVPSAIDNSDGYVVNNVAVEHVVVLSGGAAPDSRLRAGTTNAVYRFLESLGYDWIAPNETVTPAATAAPFQNLPSLNSTFRPIFENRDSNEWTAQSNSPWAGQLGYNGASASNPLVRAFGDCVIIVGFFARPDTGPIDT